MSEFTTVEGSRLAVSDAGQLWIRVGDSSRAVKAVAEVLNERHDKELREKRETWAQERNRYATTISELRAEIQQFDDTVSRLERAEKAMRGYEAMVAELSRELREMIERAGELTDINGVLKLSLSSPKLRAQLLRDAAKITEKAK